MKTLFALSGATAFCFAAAVSTAAVADDHTGDDRSGTSEMSQKAEIVTRNARGKATQVRINGDVIDVCMNQKQDNCINPRAAGLNWGDIPLSYWPGKPASQM